MVAAQTLEGLMTLDQAATEHSAIEGSWRGAEAYHLWLLAHRQLYDGQFEYARRTSLLLQEYEDLIDPVDIYSFIALACFYSKHYGRCSKAFIKLESITHAAKDRQDAYADLATSIFIKHPPADPASSRARKPDLHEPPFGPKAILTHTCMASGRDVGHADNTMMCKVCKHRSIVGELRGRQTCPLCHARYKTGSALDPASLLSSSVESHMSPTAPTMRSANHALV